VSKLAAAHLRKRYKARTVVHDVSLEVASGEVVGLLGPNGAGKTTCFYMIVGLVAADGGNISLDDENLSRLPITGAHGAGCRTCRRKRRSSAR
jgi:lipopolysaccharide export system ATP-binding protein